MGNGPTLGSTIGPRGCVRRDQWLAPPGILIEEARVFDVFFDLSSDTGSSFPCHRFLFHFWLLPAPGNMFDGVGLDSFIGIGENVKRLGLLTSSPPRLFNFRASQARDDMEDRRPRPCNATPCSTSLAV